MLARMKRGSHGEAFLKLLERIRLTIPAVSLRTSFIVGFPGETENDFNELCGFVRAGQFDWMGVFEYSDVDNAGSFALDGKVDADVVSDRRNRLMATQKKISRERLRSHKGRTETALIEGLDPEEARLQGMAPEIDGKLYLTDIHGRPVADSGRRRVEMQDRRLRPGRPRGGTAASEKRKPVSEPRARKASSHYHWRRCAFWGKIPVKHRCPICKEQRTPTTSFPFCSERCRLFDLAAWSSEKYTVSDPVFDEAELESDEESKARRKPDDIIH